MTLYSAHYLAAPTPVSMAHDELLVMAVTVTNTGTAAWPDVDGVPINLGYHWVDGAGQMVAFDGQRTPLGERVLPGASVTVGLRVLPPESAGAHRLQVDMVKEGVAWLSWQGVAMLELPITVLAAAPRPRVCLINGNCVANDAVGNNLRTKIQFFRARGYAVDALVEYLDPAIPLAEQAFFTVLSGDELAKGGRSPQGKRAVERFRAADLVVYDYSTYYPLLESIRSVRHATVLFDYHGVTPPELWGTHENALELAEAQRQVRLVKHADYAIAHSRYTAAELAATGLIGPDRISVLPYAVPLADFRPAAPTPEVVAQYGLAGQHVLLYVGRMAGNKRIGDLVAALALVRQTFPNTVLLLVGDNVFPPFAQEAEAALRQARALGCADRVIFTGPIAHADLHRFYNVSVVYVTSSLHEGFCIPVIEAMACGKPVVGTHTTALPDTIGPGGLTFPPRDAAGLAAQVCRLLANAPVLI